MTDGAANPQVFLSYSWTTPEYEERVAQLAERLYSDNVGVVFDQWDLIEGHDIHAFMEQSVSRADVTHVLILCDPEYARKADDRRGGVGKETLILTPNVYQNVKQERVIPVIMERDANGTVVLPAYMAGRRYIDLSNPETEAAGYEQLLRRLFNMPARQRPPRGTTPSFLNESYVPLRTGNSLAMFRAAVIGTKPTATGLFGDFADRLLQAYTDEEIVDVPESAEQLEEQVVESIGRFMPYCDELIEACRTASRYGADLGLFIRLHGMFEAMAERRLQHEQKRWREEAETENLAYIGWELFLSAVATLIHEGHFSAVDQLMLPMHVRSRYSRGGALRNVDVMEPGFILLEGRNRRLNLNRWDLAASMLKERAAKLPFPFERFIEADLVAWFRVATSTPEGHWFPRTLVWTDYAETLPLFMRAQAPDYFRRLAPALRVESPAHLKDRFQALPDHVFYRVGTISKDRTRYAQLFGLV